MPIEDEADGLIDKSIIKMNDLVAFGEVLWDDYGSEKIIGGAPFNVCVHAKSLGLSTLLITGIGSDKNGNEIFSEIEHFGIPAICQMNNKPTGRAEVNLDNEGAPHFTLDEDSAYDAILPDAEMDEAAKKAKVFYFGTLAQRNILSRRTLHRLIGKTKGVKVYDVNLRKGIEDEEKIIEDSLLHTDILKVNEKEFDHIISHFINYKEEQRAAESLMKAFGIKGVFITRAERGATLYSEGRRLDRDSVSKKVVDTTGCGDAFTASLIASVLKGEKDEDILKKALELSAKTATYKGAVLRF